MANLTNREVAERYGRAIIERDLDAQDRLRHPDYVSEYPQSGERIRGAANARAILEHVPGGFPTSEVEKLHGGEDQMDLDARRDALAYRGNGRRVHGPRDRVLPRRRSSLHIAVVAEFRDGKVLKETVIFGPPFDPPAWRAQWVERIKDGGNK